MSSPSQLTLPLQLLIQLRVPTPLGPDNLIYGSSVQNQPRTLPPGYIPYPEFGVAYKIYNHNVSWKIARKECNMDGAHLALIDSHTKLEHVWRQGYNKKFVHVGIIRMYDDEEWIGIGTGLPVETIPWAHGEPSGPTDCVMIKNDEKGLTNHSCFTKGEYVCEIPIPWNYNVNEITTTATGETSSEVSAN